MIMEKRKLSLNSEEIDVMRTIISPILGMTAWNVVLGYGSFFTAEFGSSTYRSQKSKHPHGKWHLWVRHGFWRLEESFHVLVASEDNRDVLARNLRKFNNQILESVEINPNTFETIFRFEKKMSFTIIPPFYHQEDYDYWMFYTPEEKVLIAGPGLEYRFIDSGGGIS